MEDVIKTEAKDFVISGIEKASGQFGINIEVSQHPKNLSYLLKPHEQGLNVAVQLACKYVKDQMDRQFGPSWHCIMGEGFSFEVTRQAKTTLHMYYAGKIAVLLFKC